MEIALTQQYELVTLFIVIHSIAVFLVAYYYKTKISERNKLLWKLLIADGFAFIVVSMLLTSTLPQSIINIISWTGYILILSYTLAVEIPGYLRISNYDKQSLKILNAIRKNLIKMKYSFDSLDVLRKNVTKNYNFLVQEQVGDLLNDYVDFSDRLGNLNTEFWELTLKEVTSSINRVSSRSKHPFPKLIDVLSLTGLSFLIAQLLQLVF